MPQFSFFPTFFAHCSGLHRPTFHTTCILTSVRGAPSPEDVSPPSSKSQPETETRLKLPIRHEVFSESSNPYPYVYCSFVPSTKSTNSLRSGKCLTLNLYAPHCRMCKNMFNKYVQGDETHPIFILDDAPVDYPKYFLKKWSFQRNSLFFVYIRHTWRISIMIQQRFVPKHA